MATASGASTLLIRYSALCKISNLS